MRYVMILALMSVVAGCALMRGDVNSAPQRIDREPQSAAPPAEIADIVSAPPPPPAARTADALDTTTQAQKVAAAAAPEGEEELLGETVASLGDPTEPGLWIKTPLVDAPGAGRLEYQGRSAKVQLLPLDGPETGGSQVSLSALRLLEAPLTDLPVIEVYRS